MPKPRLRHVVIVGLGVAAYLGLARPCRGQQLTNGSEVLAFSAQAKEDGVPALAYHWDFGDGTTADGPRAAHTYTRDADFTVQLTADGLDGLAAHQSFTVKVTGTVAAAGDVLQNRRYMEPAAH